LKRERALVEKRRHEILEELRRNDRIRVDELAQRWNVSPLTIRRDLQSLEEQKKVQRFYGGASLVENEKAVNKMDICRETISKYAASLVEDGDTIFINTSMTALNLVKYLDGKRVNVITNNGKVMNIDVPNSVSVLLSGGELRYPKYAMVGEFALKNMENLTAMKSFVGCSGISIEKGMTTGILNEVHINHLMLEQVTGESYILADHSKIGRDSSFVSQEIGWIKNLITDELTSKEQLALFREKNIKVHQVKSSLDMSAQRVV